MKTILLLSKELTNLQNEILTVCDEINQYASTENEYIDCMNQIGNYIRDFRECMWLRWDYSWCRTTSFFDRKLNKNSLLEKEQQFIPIIGLYNELQAYGLKILNRTITSAEEIAYRSQLNHFKETFAELIQRLLIFNNTYCFSDEISKIVSHANYEVKMGKYSSAYASGIEKETYKYKYLSDTIINLKENFINVADKLNSLDINTADARKSQLETQLLDRCDNLNNKYHLLFDECNAAKTYTKAESIKLWFQSINGSETVNDKFNTVAQMIDLAHWNGANIVLDEILATEPSNPGTYLGKFMVLFELNNPYDIFDFFEENNETSRNLTTAYELGNDAQKKFILNTMILHQKEITYNQYLNIMQQATTVEKYTVCKKFFEMLGDYKNSNQLSIDCEKNITSLTSTELYWRPLPIEYESIRHIPSSNYYSAIFRKPGLFEKCK